LKAGMRGKMKGKMRSKILIAALSIVAALSMASGLGAQEVRLRPGDRIELTVPQRSELDRRLVLDEAGNVSIPVIGQVMIGGLSVDEAEDVLLRALREVYPSVQSISISLQGEESRRMIYVHGEVESPGKYGFEKNPTVWEAIREAGGATSTAALESVRIIRAEGEGQRTMLVNLQAALESGDLDNLPVLEPGDAVIVSESTAMRATTGSVRVVGAVNAPGPYVLSGEKTLVDAILAAGGSAENANLNKVNVIRIMPDGGQLTMTFDFKRYLETGDIRHNPLILANDTINVPTQNAALTVLRSPTFWLAAITAYGAVYAIINR
jgi:protein involved in polysaccharide export with SLBB domain